MKATSHIINSYFRLLLKIISLDSSQNSIHHDRRTQELLGHLPRRSQAGSLPQEEIERLLSRHEQKGQLLPPQLRPQNPPASQSGRRQRRQKHIHNILISTGSTALVTVSLMKLFSGGLDLPYASSLGPEDTYSYVLEVIRLFGRMLAFPVPCIALVQGAAFAGGCMFAFSHDDLYVFKNATFCCNEVELGLPLPPGMNAVLKRKIARQKDFRDLTLYAKKFSAKDGIEAGFVDEIFQDEPIRRIFEIASQKAQYGTNKANFKKLKEEANKEEIDCCFNKQHAVGVRAQTTIASFSKL